MFLFKHFTIISFVNWIICLIQKLILHCFDILHLILSRNRRDGEDERHRCLQAPGPKVRTNTHIIKCHLGLGKGNKVLGKGKEGKANEKANISNLTLRCEGSYTHWGYRLDVKRNLPHYGQLVLTLSRNRVPKRKN